MKRELYPKWFKSKAGFLTSLLILCTMVTTMPLAAQNRAVSGSISDRDGLPIVGATIVESGNAYNGVVSDEKGYYKINVPASSSLAYDYLGYASQVVAVDGRTLINIVMDHEAVQMEDAVVIGYGTQRKADVTGAVSSMNAKGMVNTPASNIGQAMQGKLAGVQVVESSSPGSNVTIKIRGLGSINNSDPLIVIDGMPTDLGLNSLNSNDIERIDVLKDASATAVYGSRGANGVVLITTKRGKEGASELNVNASFSVQSAVNLPDMLTASEYATYSNEMLSNAGYNTNPDWSDPSTLGVGTDWIDEVTRMGVVQNYSVSYSKGTEHDRYYISGGFFDQRGVGVATSYKRFSFQANTDNEIKSWLKLSTNLKFSSDNKSSGGFSSLVSAMMANPTQSVYNEDGSYSGPVGNSMWYGDVRNPYGSVVNNDYQTRGNNLLANINAEFTILPYLKFKSTFGFDAKFWFDDNFTPAYDWDPTPDPLSTRYQSSNQSYTYLYDNFLNFDKSFGKHAVTALFGLSAQNNDYRFMSGKGTDFLFDSVSQLGNANEIESLDGNRSEWALFSYVARANYNYDNRYMVTATFRRDGSSRFGENNRYGNFPSFSAAWRLANEEWFNSKFIDDIKIRAGYGVTGSQASVGNYSYASVYNVRPYSFGGEQVNALYSVSMSNPNIQWEQVAQTNVGFDIALLGGRISASLDYYNKKTTDMLVQAAIPVTAGYEDIFTTYTNAGSVVNRGFEMSLSTLNISNNDFSWRTDFTASFNRNEILDLNSDTPLYVNEISGAYATIQQVGSPINSIYGYVMEGIFQTEEEVATSAVQVEGGTAPGDVKFKDLDNNGVIDENDRTIIGNPNPDWQLSMNNTFVYKNFDFSIFLQGVFGNEILNTTSMTMAGMSSAYNQLSSISERWTGEGSSTTVPRAVYGDPNMNNRISTRFVEDGSYLRIKSLAVGYNLSKEIAGRVGFSSARVYLSADNLCTFTSYSGIDPEVSINGIDGGVYPLSRTFSFGVNLSF